MVETLKIFKLEPMDGNNPSWELSKYKGEVIVRAEAVYTARALAQGVLCGSSNLKKHQSLLYCPWTDENLTNCVEINEHNYELSGEPEVLFPVN